MSNPGFWSSGQLTVDSLVPSSTGGPFVSIPSRYGVFTSSGTWTIPTGVTRAKIYMMGGGGGGATALGGGGGGGSGVKEEFVIFGLVAGDAYTVTIGAGGAGATASGATSIAGADGNDTTIINTSASGIKLNLRCLGGGGAGSGTYKSGFDSGGAGYFGGGQSDQGSTGDHGDTFLGENSTLNSNPLMWRTGLSNDATNGASGGLAGNNTFNRDGGGGGGPGGGKGGDGYDTGTTPGQNGGNATANSGGGGGGGSQGITSPGPVLGNGGNGGSGYVLIEYF